jgi:hypothetical protein
MIGTDGVVQMELGEAELGKVDGVKKLEKVKPPAKKEMVVNHWRSPRRKTPLATHLKLAQFAGRFYRYSYTMTLKFTKVHRELLGEDIIRRVSRILDKTVEIANYANRVNRQRLLRELEDMNRCFPMMIKLAHEQRCISDNNFSAWGKMVAELQDMTIGWVMELDKKEAEERNKKKKETLAERAKKLDEVKAAKLGAVEGAKGAGLKMQVKAEG